MIIDELHEVLRVETGLSDDDSDEMNLYFTGQLCEFRDDTGTCFNFQGYFFLFIF